MARAAAVPRHSQRLRKAALTINVSVLFFEDTSAEDTVCFLNILYMPWLWRMTRSNKEIITDKLVKARRSLLPWLGPRHLVGLHQCPSLESLLHHPRRYRAMFSRMSSDVWQSLLPHHAHPTAHSISPEKVTLISSRIRFLIEQLISVEVKVCLPGPSNCGNGR